MKQLLIVDDEKNIRAALKTTFELEGFQVETAEHGDAALGRLAQQSFDAVILDMQMPGRDGYETLHEMRQRGFMQPVVFLTAHGSIERAVEAVRLGAFDFLEKPPHTEKVLLAVNNALRQVELEQENLELRSEAAARFDMIGSGATMSELFAQIDRLAPSPARVLILGENGTGKELIARAIHRHSTRAEKPFVSVNCAAIPRELFESELFGHERGAFTGATGRRRGKFVRADGGTLFLDEVAEIPVGLQAKLLRALESGEVEPVGADRELHVDVRVLAATNRDIEAAVERGEFREDLYYRLQVATLVAPPLRERREDIPELSRHFLARAAAENHVVKALAEAALEQLAGHDYPGNVRELKNLIERLVILTDGETIGAADVATQLRPRRMREAEVGPPLQGTLKETMQQLEARVIRGVLEARRWRMTAAAEQLGIERSHLYKKLKVLGIERPEEPE
jgi:two-component system nitrogen regulation response regulator NtrX